MLDTRRKGGEAFIRRASNAAAGVKERHRGVSVAEALYSIWKKMQRKSAEIGEIYDAYAIRILSTRSRLPTQRSAVQSMWHPIPASRRLHRRPKPTYQSCTRRISLDGQPLEIQIRTHAMHAVSEVASPRTGYKEGSRADREYDAKLAWLRQVMDWQREFRTHRVRRGRQARRLPGPGLRFHAERRVKDCRRRYTLLTSPTASHTTSAIVVSRQDQQPPRAAGLQAQERRHRRNRDHQGEHGPSRDWLNLFEPATPARRSAPGSSARSATRTSPRPRLAGEGAAAPGPTSLGAVGQDRILEIARRTSSTTWMISTPRSLRGIGAQQVVRGSACRRCPAGTPAHARRRVRRARRSSGQGVGTC